MYKARQRLKQRIPSVEDYENIWKRIQKKSKESATETYNDISCLILQKPRRSGYGNISFLSRTSLIHVIVWEKFHNNFQKQDDATKVIRHLCGNPSCVQPSHLRLGTKSENARDKREHGTQNGLTEAQAREILKLKDIEGLTTKQISDKLGIKRDTVYNVIRKKTHKYLHENNVVL